MRSKSRGSAELPRIQSELSSVHRALTAVVGGTRGKGLIDDLRDAVGGTTAEILWQALLADCLRVIHGAVMADGEITDAEIDALQSILAAAATYYARTLHSEYGEFGSVDRELMRAFLDRYAADRGPFGRGARLHWPGLALCRRAAELGEDEALKRYAPALEALVGEACRVGGISADDPQWRHRLDEVDELRKLLSDEAAATGRDVDRRVQAFLSPTSVFTGVQQPSSIFENDPFDVDVVHRDARGSFERLVARAITRPAVGDLGQMLLVLGDSGAGKTHLLRGFRRHVQEGNRGFIVYAQLQSRSADYSRYLLISLVDSLSRRYSEKSGKTGLRELASGLLRLVSPALKERVQKLADDRWDGSGSITDHVNQLVYELLEEGKLSSFDPDLLRVMLYALRPDQRTTSCVYKYLRCIVRDE